jgi:glutaredoxin
MEFPEPSLVSYTVYSKSGCPNCTKVKVLIEGEDEDIWKDDNTYLTVYECNEYLKESREEFMNFMDKRAHTKITSFPIVFFNGEYIGGFAETKKFMEKRNAFADLQC